MDKHIKKMTDIKTSTSLGDGISSRDAKSIPKITVASLVNAILSRDAKSNKKPSTTHNRKRMPVEPDTQIKGCMCITGSTTCETYIKKLNSAQSLIQEIQEIKPSDDLLYHSPFHITHQSVIDPLLNDVFTQSFLSIISVFKITNTNKDSDDKFDKYCCNLDKKNKNNLFIGPHCNSINKRYLFHGTHCDNIHGILKNGLSIIKRDDVPDGGLFGHGIYTAANPIKANNYVKQNLHSINQNNPIRIMLRVEVAVGIPFLYNPNTFQRGCTEPPPSFNSVIGNINGYTEYVVYDRNAVRVTDIILYRVAEAQQFQLPGVVSLTNTQLFNVKLIYLKHMPSHGLNINLPVDLNKCFVNLLNFTLQQNDPYQNMVKICSEINKLLFLHISIFKFIDKITIIQKSVTQNYSINMLFIKEIIKAMSEYKLYLLSLSLKNFNQYSMHCDRVLLRKPTTSIDDITYSGAFVITPSASARASASACSVMPMPMPIIINAATDSIPPPVMPLAIIQPLVVIHPPVPAIIPSVASASASTSSIVYQLPKRSKTFYETEI
jgi:hypothetical protein